MDKRRLEMIKKYGTLSDYNEALKDYNAEQIHDYNTNRLKKLEHHEATTVGLYATDKVPADLFRIIFFDMIDEIGMDGEKTFSPVDFEYYESYFKKGINKLMFQITNA